MLSFRWSLRSILFSRVRRFWSDGFVLGVSAWAGFSFVASISHFGHGFWFVVLLCGVGFALEAFVFPCSSGLDSVFGCLGALVWVWFQFLGSTFGWYSVAVWSSSPSLVALCCRVWFSDVAVVSFYSSSLARMWSVFVWRLQKLARECPRVRTVGPLSRFPIWFQGFFLESGLWSGASIFWGSVSLWLLCSVPLLLYSPCCVCGCWLSSRWALPLGLLFFGGIYAISWFSYFSACCSSSYVLCVRVWSASDQLFQI